jgi:hypothetical protein
MSSNIGELLLLGIFFGLPCIGLVSWLFFTSWTKHEERKIELGGVVPTQNQNVFRQPFRMKSDTQSEITVTDELRAEIRRVSETATQYDLSIQHTLDQIQKRLDTIETRLSPTRVDHGTSLNSEPVEQITAGRSGLL